MLNVLRVYLKILLYLVYDLVQEAPLSAFLYSLSLLPCFIYEFLPLASNIFPSSVALCETHLVKRFYVVLVVIWSH